MEVLYTTIEFHRFGTPKGLLKPENRYIRTAGWDTVATEVSPSLDHDQFQIDLFDLRYNSEASEADVLAARERLAAEAACFLPAVAPESNQLLQLDVVANAAELWALPFEACYAKHDGWLKSPTEGVVITRRIRGGFSDKATAWPTKPRVLFAHAPVAEDLEETLIADHLRALTLALHPWSEGKPVGPDLLLVKEVSSDKALAQARQEFKPTFIHLLAHGTKVKQGRLPEDASWGLRLGSLTARGTAPSDIADALSPVDGLPLVVTIAACDSGNSNSVLAKQSIVQELHRCGVPVVVGSQFPFTKTGSTVLASRFYECLLRGDDVRIALHAARVGLKGDPATGHDWLSLVGYLRLPPAGYGEHLKEVGVRLGFGLLEAASSRADRLAASETELRLPEFAEVESALRQSLVSLADQLRHLTGRKDLIDECRGLEASANKRLAELLFVRGRDHPATRAADWEASRQSLRVARDKYREAYYASFQSHWLGVQQLALDVVLTGSVASPIDWLLVLRAAEVERDSSEESYWPLGSLVETALIAPHAGQPRDLDAAIAMVDMLVSRAKAAGNAFAVMSTRRQIARYVHWWTTGHGFFPGGTDLSADARQILKRFDELA